MPFDVIEIHLVIRWAALGHALQYTKINRAGADLCQEHKDCCNAHYQLKVQRRESYVPICCSWILREAPFTNAPSSRRGFSRCVLEEEKKPLIVVMVEAMDADVANGRVNARSNRSLEYA